MAKRRFITQLPSIHQTETLKKFFGATVDQVFQPGTASQISGYIGQKPAYYDAVKDFYIPEPTAERAARQLDPTMATVDINGAVTGLSFYDEIINYLRTENADTSDHNRLFADEFYGWAPPIDLDKLQNFRRYYWFGDDPTAVPALTLTAPRTVYDNVDGTTTDFAMPPVLADIGEERETPMLFVDGIRFPFTRLGDVLRLDNPPAAGSLVTVFRYGDLVALIRDLKNFDPRLLNPNSPLSRLTTGVRVTLDDGITLFEGYDLVSFEAAVLDHPRLCRNTVDVPWDDVTRPSILVVDGDGLTAVGDTKIMAQYVTIGRGSRTQNPWSLNNHWYHEDAVSWANEDFRARQAQRPIVEFHRDLELHNYGTTRRAPISATLTGDPRVVPQPAPSIDANRDLSNWSFDPFSTEPVDGTGLHVVPLSQCNGLRPGQVFVDNGHMVNNGDRILILDNADASLKNFIINVKLSFAERTVFDENNNPSVQRVEVMVFELEEGQIGDVVLKPGGRNVLWDDKSGVDKYYLDRPGIDELTYEYTLDTLEYSFNGTEWTATQPFNPFEVPLFALYTTDRVKHAALNASFVGNPVFGYKRSSVPGAKIDPHVGYALSYDTKGQIVFENFQATQTTAGIAGLALTRIVGASADQDRYASGWHVTGERSHQNVVEGVYETPLNLFGNPDNLEVTEITRGQWFDNFANIFERQPDFAGTVYSNEAWRDNEHDFGRGYTGTPWAAQTAYLVGAMVSHRGLFYRCTTAHVSGDTFGADNWRQRPIHKIVQNRSPLLKTMLLSNDRRFDFPDACRFVDQEYTRFRNKFVQQTIEVLRTGVRRTEDSDAQWVETVLTQIAATKTTEFPFAFSTMAGGQYFIPPTAASLGLLPAVAPGVEVDDTYTPAVTFLRGHDGSRTPLSGQFQDRILLALERQIYTNILARFRGDARPIFDFTDVTESRYRGDRLSASIAAGETNPCAPVETSLESGRTTYAHAEIVRMLTPTFIRWAQVNGLDYRSNTGYLGSDPFTFNYRGTRDRDGKIMPGSFRAIYRYYFDTDRPHQVPWEMLGFASKPTWWDETYGVAPYTSGNATLWQDLRDGRIRAGARAGIDARFARPDLLSVLPVDDRGRLRDPIACGIIPVAPAPTEASAPWLIGDDGPVENLWKLSVSYPFARCLLGFLMRPAQWIETLWETEFAGTLADGQFYNTRTQNRPQNGGLRVHAEIDPNTGLPRPVLGVQQWIVDHMTANAQPASLLGDAVRALQVRLAHKMAGFTQAENLRVFADNFGILPEEDTTVALIESPPLREAVYSGVIVEWTGTGWSVVGYDSAKEGFCILPGDANGPRKTIKVGGDDLRVFEWHPTKYFPTNVLVEYENTVYRCLRAHTSGTKFEAEYWSPQTVPARSGTRVTIYEKTTGEIAYVPYATVFKSLQAVAEFLYDYGRSLEAAGFVFDYVDPKTGTIQNWEAMVYDFLAWAQMDWQPGAFIALSPAASQLKFVSPFGTVYSTEETSNGTYGLLDRTGRPLSRSSTFVSRLDETTTILTLSDDLFAARLRVGEIEHAIVFSNRTIFNDVVYEPLLSLRQPRLRLIGMRTPGWTGRLDAPGFIIQGSEAMPNFWRAAENLRTMFDIERSEDRTLRDYARNVFGYQTRPYLDNLLVSETEQFEFYQGMIQQKGAPGVFQKLTRSRLIDDQTELKFQEEWGVRVGSYGGNDTRTPVSFKYLRSDMRSNPQFIQFGFDDPNDATLGLLRTSDRWITPPKDVLNVFPNRDPATPYPGITSPTIETRNETLPLAGWVRTSEVRYTASKASRLSDLYRYIDGGFPGDFGVGTTVWVYDMQQVGKTWDVLRSHLIGQDTTTILRIDTGDEDAELGSLIRFTFSEPHGLTNARDRGLYFVVQNAAELTPDNVGMFPILDIESPTTLLIQGSPITQARGFEQAEQPNGFIMRSQRFASVAARDAFYAQFPASVGQIAYLDSAPGYNGWVVTVFDGTQSILLRQQPPRVDARRLSRALVYDLDTTIDATSLRPQPLRVSGLTVIDPSSGLISGRADRELDYKFEGDPACYDTIAAWGPERLGHLWWDLSTVRFLDAQTDIIDYTNADRYEREIAYRVDSWGQIAAGSTVDVYEWTRALNPPNNLVAPSESGYINYNVREEYDNATGQVVQAYYYWVRNPETIPARSERTISAAEVATLIRDIANSDQPWVAPIMTNGMLVSNISQYLDDDSSVLQFEVTAREHDIPVHNQFMLVRKGDASSQPPPRVWSNMRNSLSAFDDFVRPVPDRALLPSESNGNTVRERRSHTGPGRAEVLSARRAFVETVNQMLRAAPMLVDRPTITQRLTRETPSFARLSWRRPDGVDYIDAPPQNSYDFTAESIEERNAIIETQAYLAALGGDLENVNIEKMAKNRGPRILMTNYTAEKPSWSIWEGYLPPTPRPQPPKPPVNQPPVALDDGGSTGIFLIEAGESFVITAAMLLGNDYDPDDDPISITFVGPAPVGMLTGANVGGGVGTGPGPWVYQTLKTTPPGPVRIPYQITDTHDNTADAVLNLMVKRSNLPPVAADDTNFSVEFSEVLRVPFASLLANDSDPDGDTISVASVGVADYGTVEIVGNEVVYTAPSYVPTPLPPEGAGGSDALIIEGGNGRFRVCCSGEPRTYTIPVEALAKEEGGYVYNYGRISDLSYGEITSTYAGIQLTLKPCEEIEFEDGVAKDYFNYEVERFLVDDDEPTTNAFAEIEIIQCAAVEPEPDSNPAKASFTYTITDGRGETATATVTIDLTLPALQAVDDEFEMTVKSVNLVANDDAFTYQRTKGDIL